MRKEFWLVIAATIIMTFAQYLFKKASIIFPNIGWQLALAFLLYVSVAFLILIALKKGALSYVFPMLATSFIWVALISVFVFGEQMSVVNWIGIASLVAGVVMIQ